MKKFFRDASPPKTKEESLQAIIDYLIDSGMTPPDVNQFIHVNIPALGGDRSIVNCAQENNWYDAWRVAEAYIAGDYF